MNKNIDSFFRSDQESSSLWLSVKQEKRYSSLYILRTKLEIFSQWKQTENLLFFYTCVVLQLARSSPPKCSAEFEPWQFLRVSITVLIHSWKGNLILSSQGLRSGCSVGLWDLSLLLFLTNVNRLPFYAQWNQSTTQAHSMKAEWHISVGSGLLYF